MEINHLYINTQTNTIGKALIMGFAQTAQSKEIKQYFFRGKELSQKHVETFSDYLIKEDLPAPANSDPKVLNTTTNVFSDRLMMYHTLTMIQAGIGNMSSALATSLRRDLVAQYAAFIPEITLYAEDGANLMIKNGWLEEPPQADDRDQIIKGSY